MASINEKSAGVTEFLKSNNLVAKVAGRAETSLNFTDGDCGQEFFFSEFGR